MYLFSASLSVTALSGVGLEQGESVAGVGGMATALDQEAGLGADVLPPHASRVKLAAPAAGSSLNRVALTASRLAVLPGTLQGTGGTRQAGTCARDLKLTGILCPFLLCHRPGDLLTSWSLHL